MAAGGQTLLILRAGGDMQWVFSATFHPVTVTLDTPDGPRSIRVLTGAHQAVVHFSKLGEGAAVDGSNLPPGFGTWLDRGMESNEPRHVVVHLDTFGVQRVVQPPPQDATNFPGFDKTEFTTTQELLFDSGTLFALKVKRPALGSIEVVRGTRTISPWPPKEAAMAEMTLEPNSFTFAGQAVESEAKVKIEMSNSGEEFFDILAMEFIGEHPQDFDLLAADCLPTGEVGDIRLGPGEQCELVVRFRPTGLGLRKSTLLIRHTAPLSPHTVELSGNATAATTAVDIHPSNFSFGQQTIGTETALTITLTNTGTIPLTVADVRFEGANPDDFLVVGTTCLAGAIEPNAACEVVIAFRPTDVGLRTASLVITDNTFDSPHRLSLAGAGAPSPDSGSDPLPAS